jgi:hypothetical protein
MRIQLKQHEIEAAIAGYIASQGISVSNKSVTMDFTSGRKNNGLSVEVVIEDSADKAVIPPGPINRDCPPAEAAPEQAETNTEVTEGVVPIAPPASSLFG